MTLTVTFTRSSFALSKTAIATPTDRSSRRATATTTLRECVRRMWPDCGNTTFVRQTVRTSPRSSGTTSPTAVRTASRVTNH